MRKLLATLALLLGVTQAEAQTSYTFPDFGGTSRTAGAYGTNCSGVICPLAVPTDGSGNALGGATGSAVPAGAVYMGITSGGNLTGWNGAVTNAGTFAVQAAESGTWTVQPGNTANSTPWLFTINQGGNSATVTGSNALKVDGSAVTQPVSGSASIDPCSALAKTSVAISQTGTAKLIAKTSAKKNYICSIMVVGADAENISLVEGTKTTTECDTSTAALIGGTTAANGPNLAANGGFTLGSGGYTVVGGANNNFDVCLFQSGSGRVAGVLTYVQN